MIRLQRDTSPAGLPAAPLVAAGSGLGAGVGAALLLSALARVLPGMGTRPPIRMPAGAPAPPGRVPDGGDPDPHAVREWQARSQSPAAYRPGSVGPTRAARPAWPGAAVTPGLALAQPVAPGPEGLAEQFAFKVASGIFQRDITSRLRAAGLATHLAYGGAWGALFGLLHPGAPGARRPRLLAGALYGLVVWVFGPALLVPAMRLARPPHRDRPTRTAAMVAGHLAYGVATAALYRLLAREAA